MTRKKLMAGAATVALVVGSAFASSAEAQSVFDGFYSGVSAGYYHFNADNIKDDFVACCSAKTNSDGNRSGEGYNIGILGGYGQTFADRYYLGGEIDASFNVARTNTFVEPGCGSAMEGIAKVKAKESYGASARFGYLFTPTILGYLRGGLQATRFSAQYHNLECDAPDLTERSKYAIGGRVGAGADINIGTWDWLNAPIFLRLDYAHTFYGSLNISQHNDGIGFGGRVEGHTFRFDPSDDIVRAAFIVKFGSPAPAPPPVAAAPPPPPPPPAAPPPAPPKQFVVYFEFDKSNLTPEGSKVVLDAAAAYKQTGSARIAITGYTDLSGTQKYNLGLSKRRADTVHAALVRDGVPDNVIAEAWRGKENPAVPTPDGVREPRNRRVEIVE
jgi:outer membrane protein OmpA-like peptidoglycan-associated protein/opacity protein-like surface antigen